MKTLFLTLSILAMSAQAHAGSGELNGVWNLSRDLILDGSIAQKTERREVECNSHHNKFVCHYIGANIGNDSIFEGEINRARTTKIITFFQLDSTYFGTHSGREVSDRRFMGTWYDVDGNAGDFELGQ